MCCLVLAFFGFRKHSHTVRKSTIGYQIYGKVIHFVRCVYSSSKMHWLRQYRQLGMRKHFFSPFSDGVQYPVSSSITFDSLAIPFAFRFFIFFSKVQFRNICKRCVCGSIHLVIIIIQYQFGRTTEH